jgi:phosphotransferase system enzyme I (PtsP)
MRAAFTQLIEIGEREDGLHALCEHIAAELGVQICTIYVRERDAARRVSGGLVLRATRGQPQEQVGNVKLRVGEGLTGFAVECLRPVTVARAEHDARNRAFDGIDESEHPGFVAIPLIEGGTAIGALVLQRSEARAFDTTEIVIAEALAVLVVHALERHRAATPADVQAHAQRPSELSLHGRMAVSGRALGTAALRIRTVSTRKGAVDPVEERARLGRAIAETAEEIAALEAWAMAEAPLDRATKTRALSSSRFVLDDARLRSALLRGVQEGLAAERAVEKVIADYVRPLGVSADPALLDRALEVEALGLRICGRLDGRAHALTPGSILCASRITVCDVLELAAAHGGGFLLEGPAEKSPGISIAFALELPVLCEVSQLFRWVSDGDRLLLRADEGIAVLNPSRVEIAAFRRSEA